MSKNFASILNIFLIILQDLFSTRYFKLVLASFNPAGGLASEYLIIINDFTINDLYLSLGRGLLHYVEIGGMDRLDMPGAAAGI